MEPEHHEHRSPAAAPESGAAAGGPLLEILSISKTFPGQIALERAHLEVWAGQVHALVGQNGSGKSTLIKALAGYHKPDPGADVRILGRSVAIEDLGAEDRRRLHVMHQDLGLVLSLNVMENLALGRGFVTSRTRRIRWGAEYDRAHELMQRFGLEVDPRARVGDLAAAERAVLSLVRAMQDWDGQGGVLILDEPTASLPRSEVERLFEAIRRIAAQGAGIVFVSHRLDEVFTIADYVTVLRDGRVVAGLPIAEVDERGLIELIVGRPIEDLYPSAPPARDDVVLEVDNLWGQTLEGFSLEVRAGEIVGVAGLVGSGRDELPALLFDGTARALGTVRVGGREVPPGPRAAIDCGMAFVPADRKNLGSIATESVAANITLGRLGSLYHRGWLSADAHRREALTWMGRFDVRPNDPDRLFGTLSGGNQQKAVLARWLRTEPRVLVLDDPTQGVDVGSKAKIYELLAEAAAAGAVVVLCSSDAEELAHVCDRALVLRHGRIAATLERPQLTSQSILEQSMR